MIGNSIEVLKGGNARDKALAKVLEGVLDVRGKDIPFPKQPSVTRTEAIRSPSENPLAQVIAEYKKGPLTPELVTNFWQNFIRVKIEESETAIIVPTIAVCDRTPEELEALLKEGKGMVYNPGFKYSELGRIFPRMQNYCVAENSPIKDEYERVGWVDVEMGVDAPNIDTTEQMLRDLFVSQGRDGIRLSTYIWASHVNKELTGRFFDQGPTWSRMLGSRDGGDVVDASFFKSGGLSVDWSLKSQDRYPSIGGRSEGVKS